MIIIITTTKAAATHNRKTTRNEKRIAPHATRTEGRKGEAGETDGQTQPHNELAA